MAGSGYRREAGAMDAAAPVDEGAVDELIVLRMRARSMREYARADQLRDQLRGTGVSVTRVGDRIILNMPSNITFPTDQSSILPAFYPTLNSVALVLKEYDKSIVNVYGHTDSQGSDGYNFTLSQQRASSVSQLLASQGVDPRRLNTQGFGESQPVASNDTESGRAQNRRVEIAISPLTAG